MSTMNPSQALVSHSFRFKIDGIQVPHVIDVSAASLEVEEIESKTQTEQGVYVHQKLPGVTKPSELTVTRPLTADKTMSNWWEQVAKGDMSGATKTAVLEICDLTGTVMKTFTWQDAWIKKIETSQPKAGGNEPMTEKCTIAYTTGKVE